MDPSATLLFGLAVAFLHLSLTMIVLQPRWALAYVMGVAFFGALYVRRLLWIRHQLGRVYDGLWYAAIMLAALASALLFFSVGDGMPLLLAIGVWFGLGIAAYYFHCIIKLHIDEAAAVQADRMAQVQVQVQGDH